MTTAVAKIVYEGEIVECDSYESLVDKGRQAAQSQWILGDLANAVETHYRDRTLERYADDIGVPLKTLQNCRTVAVAFPEKSRRRDISWSTHAALASLSDDKLRFKEITKVTSVVEARLRVKHHREEALRRIAKANADERVDKVMAKTVGGTDEVAEERQEQTDTVDTGGYVSPAPSVAVGESRLPTEDETAEDEAFRLLVHREHAYKVYLLLRKEFETSGPPRSGSGGKKRSSSGADVLMDGR